MNEKDQYYPTFSERGDPYIKGVSKIEVLTKDVVCAFIASRSTKTHDEMQSQDIDALVTKSKQIALKIINTVNNQ